MDSGEDCEYQQLDIGETFECDGNDYMKNTDEHAQVLRPSRGVEPAQQTYHFFPSGQ